MRVGVCDSLCLMHLTLGVLHAFKPIFCLNLKFEFKDFGIMDLKCCSIVCVVKSYKNLEFLLVLKKGF